MAKYTEQPIIDGKSFNTDGDVTFGKVKVLNSGGKIVPIYNAHMKRNLHLSTPLMLTWGVSKWENEGSRESYDMTLQFPNDDYKSESTTQFLENMLKFDKFIKKSAIENSKDWFNKTKMTEEVIEALYTPNVKYPKYPKGHAQEGDPDYNRAPGLKIKIPYWSDNGFDVEIYDTNQKRLFPNDEDDSVSPITLIPKATNVALVIQCGGIWFAGGKFGVTWRLFQAVVKPRATLKGKCHISLDPVDKDKLEQEAAEDDDTGVENVADSDEDEEEEVVEEPVQEAEPEKPAEPEEPPTKPKKRVVKKKTT